MKPIEPGCLCVITGCRVDPVNIGKFCTTVKRVSSGDTVTVGEITGVYIGDSGWLVIGEELNHDEYSGWSLVLERDLCRIDDYDDSQDDYSDVEIPKFVEDKVT